jgi:hypothetical protein
MPLRSRPVRAALLLLLAGSVYVGDAQLSTGPQPPNPPGQNTSPGMPSLDSTMPGEPPDPAQIRMREAQQKTFETERQRRLVADTARLLQLATSLQADVAKTNKDILSVDVIRRADEIEKLAKAVKDRMRAQ